MSGGLPPRLLSNLTRYLTPLVIQGLQHFLPSKLKVNTNWISKASVLFRLLVHSKQQPFSVTGQNWRSHFILFAQSGFVLAFLKNCQYFLKNIWKLFYMHFFWGGALQLSSNSQRGLWRSRTSRATATKKKLTWFLQATWNLALWQRHQTKW